ncbi:hypothetical protein E2C01_045009 [Portunus trituberculatus]|uniref:Uncharacterized protein n=1 Tax=Portunus trituberculatus TaxID=210409 RepID=A0A5B7FTL5_PORTR|nr:hypothetical protein [Portunus trituberculatus]
MVKASARKLLNAFISLGSAHRELLYRQKDGTGATSYASLVARSSAESVGPKTSATSNSLVGGGSAVRLANRFALLSDDSAESSERCDGNPPALTKVTLVVDVHALPASPKHSKGLIKWDRGSAESIDLAQPKQPKISPGAHDRKSFRDRSTMVAPMVSVQPSETPSVSDRASCEDGLSMELSNDIITAVPCGSTVAKSAVQPDPHPQVTGRNGDNSHHSLVGREAAVHRPSTSQLPVSSHRLIISSQLSSSFYNGTVEAFAPRGRNSELYSRSSLQPVSLNKRLCLVIVLILVLLAIVLFLELLSLNRVTTVAQLS